MKYVRNFIPVNVGDIVEVNFDRIGSDPGTHTFTITEVERRYGLLRGMRQPPIVSGWNEKGESQHFCASFITKVLKRVPSRKVNIFRHISLCIEVHGSRWCGSLRALAIKALAELDFNIDQGLHEGRLRDSFERSGIGLKDGLVGWEPITVDKNLFRKWIRRNYTRILETTSERTRWDTEIEEANCKLMDDWLEKDLRASGY